MSKRKNKSTGQVHPQQSFQELVAQATLAKLGGYIDDQVQGLAQALLQRQVQANNNLMTRILCTEEIIMELNPSITKETLAERVASIQDRHEGYAAIAADDVVAEGDRVRAELKTRTADQTEFQGSSRLQIDNVGSGSTLGKELEGAMLGMKAGEVKEVKFGKDESLVASITLNRASRAPKLAIAKEEEPSKEAAPEAAADEVVPQTTTEAPNADANAG